MTDEPNAQALGTPNWTAGGATPTTMPPAGHEFTTSSPTETKPLGKLGAKPAEPVPDTKEQHFEAIRYLLDQLKVTADAPTKVTLDQICTRLDEIDPPEKTVKW